MRASDEILDDDEPGAQPFSLDRIVSAFRRRLRLIATIVMVTTTLTVTAVLMLPNRYEAAAVVQIDPRKKTISDLEGVISELKADAATIESEAEIIRSRAILLKVIDLLDLRNDPEFVGGRGALTRLFVSQPLESQGRARPPPPESRTNTQDIGTILGPRLPGSSQPQRDEIAAAVLERLRVRRVRTTLLIEIRFTASDPQKAAKIANTIAEVYLAEQLESKRRASGLATEILEAKLTEMRGKLADAEREVETYKATHGIFATEGQILSEKQLARLMEQTIIARNATAEARSKYEQARTLREGGLDDTAISDVLASHTVRLMKEKLADATRRRAELATRYGPRHPSLQEATAEVRSAEAKVASEVRNVIAQLENEYRQAARRETQLLNDLMARKASEARVKEKTVRLKELEREAETTKQLFEALLSRYKQTAETQDLQLPDARLVEQADTPLKPAGPKRKQLLAVGFAMSLALGFGIALLLEFGTTGIGRPEDAEGVLDIAHLSSLPLLDEADDGTHEHMRNVRLMIADPISTYAESIRDVRREIDFHNTTHASGRIILVAASLPGEGSSLVASNLAHHYALTGQKTLLIDADMRHANLSRELSPVRTGGLLDALYGRTEVERAILRDSLTGLCFLPAMATGPGRLSNPELLSTRAMATLFDRLRRQFDVIVLDTPPLLPVMDARIIADRTDQILFVMAWRRTPKQLARRALKGLSINQEKIVGVVVNKVDPLVLADSRGFSQDIESAGRANSPAT